MMNKFRKIKFLYFIELIYLTAIDFFRYYRSGFKFKNRKDFYNLLAKINLNYHSIEKGLSNTNIRYGFGKNALTEIFINIDKCIKFHPDKMDNSRIQSAFSVIESYLSIHTNDSRVDWVRTKFENYKNYIFTQNKGGWISKNKSNKSDLNFQDLALNRSSVRDYENKLLNKEKVLTALEIAQKTPSVCNRQAWKSYVIYDSTLINEVLKLQNGLRNMGENIQGLIVVTGDNRFFANARERNQVYSDCGMYSMSLIYALESQNIANCALNANFGNKTDKIIRKLVNIDYHESIIMFISLGEFKENYKVPFSNRVKITENTSVIDNIRL